MKRLFSYGDVVAWTFLLLWAYTGLSKLFDYQETVVQLGKSPMIGSVAPVVAITLPVIELALAAMLLMEKTKRLAIHLSLALMVAFTTYLIVLTRFSYYIPCACGGIFGKGIMINGKLLFKMEWQQHIYLNLVFVALGCCPSCFLKKQHE